MTSEQVRCLLEAGQLRLAQGDWRGARAAFEEARSLGETPEALEGLGMAAFCLDDAETVFDAREQAYRLYRQRGDQRSAGRLAMTIAMDSFYFRGQTAVAKGWQRRASSLLEGLPPGPEQGWLRLWQCELSLATGEDVARVRDVAKEAVAIGRALGDADVEMLALSQEGLALVTEGSVEEGMRRLDEATTAALSGEMVNPAAIGISCCHLIAACELVRDYGRAAEWCERVRDYASRVDFTLLSSMCRGLHAEVLIWGGAWQKAESELEDVIRYFANARPSMQENALVRLADLRRRQGRFDDATALLEKVDWHPYGRLIRAAIALDRGELQAAADLALRILEQAPSSNRTHRALCRELLLRAELALGNAPAPETLEEIRALAASIGTDPLQASALTAEGLLAAAAGEHEQACRALEGAVALFARAGAPYETAHARVDLARSLRALGRDDLARTELERACRVFEELGAGWAARSTRQMLDEASGHPGVALRPSTAGGLSARELEVVRFLAQGLSNSQIAKRLGLSEFTVKRHVANILTKLALPTRAAAAAHAAREGWV